MIEVVPATGGYRWHWISAAGRILWHGDGVFHSDVAAWTAAAAWRRKFWGWADSVDHRQARCI